MHLRTLREQRGWTQNDLRQKSKVPQAVISRLERNKVVRKSMAIVVALGKALDVDPLSIEFGLPPRPTIVAKVSEMAETPGGGNHGARRANPGAIQGVGPPRSPNSDGCNTREAIARAQAGELLSAEELGAIFRVTHAEFQNLMKTGEFDVFLVKPAIGPCCFSGIKVYRYLCGDAIEG